MINVTAAIIERNGRILIAKRSSNSSLPDKWEFPGGKVEVGETPEQCLCRELKEEFDIEVTIGDFVGSNVYHYDHIHIDLIVYRAFWVGGTLTMKAHKAHCWVTADQLVEFDFAPADIPFVDYLCSQGINNQKSKSYIYFIVGKPKQNT
jgi:8-oxo-dGTP diphosphatase